MVLCRSIFIFASIEIIKIYVCLWTVFLEAINQWILWLKRKPCNLRSQFPAIFVKWFRILPINDKVSHKRVYLGVSLLLVYKNHVRHEVYFEIAKSNNLVFLFRCLISWKTDSHYPCISEMACMWCEVILFNFSLNSF